jgi:hypothetical protein
MPFPDQVEFIVGRPYVGGITCEPFILHGDAISRSPMRLGSASPRSRLDRYTPDAVLLLI